MGKHTSNCKQQSLSHYKQAPVGEAERQSEGRGLHTSQLMQQPLQQTKQVVSVSSTQFGSTKMHFLRSSENAKLFLQYRHVYSVMLVQKGSLQRPFTFTKVLILHVRHFPWLLNFPQYGETCLHEKLDEQQLDEQLLQFPKVSMLKQLGGIAGAHVQLVISQLGQHSLHVALQESNDRHPSGSLTHLQFGDKQKAVRQVGTMMHMPLKSRYPVLQIRHYFELYTQQSLMEMPLGTHSYPIKVQLDKHLIHAPEEQSIFWQLASVVKQTPLLRKYPLLHCKQTDMVQFIQCRVPMQVLFDNCFPKPQFKQLVPRYYTHPVISLIQMPFRDRQVGWQVSHSMELALYTAHELFSEAMHYPWVFSQKMVGHAVYLQI